MTEVGAEIAVRARAAHEALCRLEDELDRIAIDDRRVSDETAAGAVSAIRLLRDRWQHDTDRKLKRALDEARERP